MTKYCKSFDALALNHIRKNGDVEALPSAIGIPKSAFKKWICRHESFYFSVSQGLMNYANLINANISSALENPSIVEQSSSELINEGRKCLQSMIDVALLSNDQLTAENLMQQLR